MDDTASPLRFGAFITPINQPPLAAVELAVAAETAGLDLVTFQDHPYQPAFHDTWTLLSYVAACTERIGLAGNVLNLPLRPPAVLARSVASLDLLTGGRVSVGLGAGAFWQAIEAMGGERRSGGQAVDALVEAIEIMRDVWAPEVRGGIRRRGEYYRVDGAKRGPAPAHSVPIWLGAYGPRMLRLTGRVADGWLPSLGNLAPGDLGRGNAVIDAAAEAADRDPAAITRLLNIAADTPVDVLIDLARHERVSVFIAPLDDADEIRRFATEVVPAVRAGVAE